MNKNTRKNIISGAITGLILLAGIMGFLKMSSMKKSTVSDKIVKKERRSVKFSTFKKATESNDLELDGRLKASERVNITSKVQGVMQEGNRSIREGMYVKKGEVMFTVDNREAKYNVLAQRSALMTAITQMMPDLKFDYPQSFEKWENYLRAFDVNKSISPLPEPSSDQEKYFVSGRNIYNQFYNIKSQETRLNEYTIYAPFSGVITKVDVFPGALISPGQALANIINTGRYEIAAPVPLDNLKYIKTGHSVKLYSDEMDKEWNGKVNRIGTQIDPTTQNLPVYISVSGKGLKDGMYLKGKLAGNSIENVTKLPKNIFLTPNSVFVIQDSTLVAKTVTTIKRTSEFVLVQNLEENEMVVTGSLAGLFEGQKVNY